MKATRRERTEGRRISRFSEWHVPACEVIRGWRAGCSATRRNMRARSTSAGFTLVELMITVAIIGVLALLATVGYARWARTAKTAEATAMLGGIKSAEETWRAEHLNYLDVSSGNLGTYYPLVVPNAQKVAWNPRACAGTPVCDRFLLLNVHADSAVYYRYSVAAGPADGTAKAFDGRSFSPAAHDPWFVAKAFGDLDGNGLTSSYWTSSFATTILSERPGE